MQSLLIDDLVFIVRNGGGLTMRGAGRSIDDLLMIVRNATEGSHITFTDMSGRPIDDLVQIVRNKVGLVTISE
jgi:hypothetical protein